MRQLFSTVFTVHTSLYSRVLYTRVSFWMIICRSFEVLCTAYLQISSILLKDSQKKDTVLLQESRGCLFCEKLKKYIRDTLTQSLSWLSDVGRRLLFESMNRRTTQLKCVENQERKRGLTWFLIIKWEQVSQKLEKTTSACYCSCLSSFRSLISLTLIWITFRHDIEGTRHLLLNLQEIELVWHSYLRKKLTICPDWCEVWHDDGYYGDFDSRSSEHWNLSWSFDSMFEVTLSAMSWSFLVDDQTLE